MTAEASASRPRRRRLTALVLLVSAGLMGSACAGNVGRYGDAAPATGGVPAGQPGGVSEAAAGNSAAAMVTEEAGRAGPGPQMAAGHVVSPGARPTATTRGTLGPVTTVVPSRPPAARGQGAGASTVGGGEVAAASTAGVPAVPAGPRTTTGVTRDTIKVGFFYPQTGAYAALLHNAPDVLEAAFQEAGPIHGRRVVLETYDDGTANASTIQVEEKRAKDESFALFSAVGETNVVLAPLAEQHRIPLVAGNIDDKVALPLTYTFPVSPYVARQARILPGFIKKGLGAADKRIGIVYEGTSTAGAAKEAFKVKADEAGLTVVFEQPIAQNQSTCANEVSNLQAHRVELVFMMNGPLGAICMLRDARALAFRPLWTGVGASWNFNVVAAATGGAADGIRTLASVTTLETPAGRHFSEVMRRSAPNSGLDSDDIMLAVYAFAQPLIEALRRMGPDATRENFVQTFETKMSGYDSGYLPPPTFGPHNRSGPLAVGVTACCSSGRWATAQAAWQTGF